MKKLQIGFATLKSDGILDTFDNRFASKVVLKSPYIHSVLYFPPPEDLVCELTATQGKVILFEGKEFSTRGWEFISINVTPTVYDNAMNFVQSHIHDKYSYCGYYCLTFYPFFRTKKSWLCSEFVAAALINSGAIQSNEFKKIITPPDLLNALMKIIDEGKNPNISADFHPKKIQNFLNKKSTKLKVFNSNAIQSEKYELL